MSSSDDELEQLLMRTRASRDRINARLTSLGEAPGSIRSPLREKNTVNIEPARDRSPLKTTTPIKSTTTTTSTKQSSYSTTPSKSSLPPSTTFSTSPSKSSLFSTSPSKSSLFSTSPSKSSLFSKSPSKSSLSRTPGGSQHRREEESFNREVTEKTTFIVTSPKRSPGGKKETYTKTTITETEEKIEKKEVLKITEIGNSKNTPHKLFAEVPSRLKFSDESYATKSESSSTTNDNPGKRVIETKTVTFKNSPLVKTVFSRGDNDDDEDDDEGQSGSSDEETGSPDMGSPSRFGSCRDLSPGARTIPITRTPTASAASPGRTPMPNTKGQSDANFDFEFDPDIETGRRKRLQALASKFKDCDDDEIENSCKKRAQQQTLGSAAASSSPSRRDRTKVVDVDKEINRSKNLAKDPGFISSLKAQGFEESQSKTKLVYDFSNRGRTESPSQKSESPIPRSQSPFKMNPHQFICPQRSNTGSPVTVTKTPVPAYRSASPTRTPAASYRPASPIKTPASVSSYRSTSPAKTPASTYRSGSPTRMVTSAPRATSPFRPHPLQFVSPAKAAEAAAIASSVPLKSDPEGPPKPARTYATPARTLVTEEEPDEEVQVKTWRTERTVTLNPVPARSSPAPKKSPAKDEALTDTASRRSIVEKRNLFEERTSSPSSRTPDPAMLPMSERRKLFEKNLTVPKPVARFGESVTPAMLSKAQQPAVTPNIRPPPKMARTEPAWKRKREVSPERQAATPLIASRRSPPKSAVAPQPTDKPEDPLIKRFEKSRKLFENVKDNWRDNEIAKQQEEAKEKDMKLLLNRFDHQRQYMEQNRSPKSVSDSDEVGNESGDETEPKVNTSSPTTNYPGVNSLKKIKVSPPKPGQMYPDLDEIHDERPDTAMSGESVAPSEAPSLGTSIKRVASAHRRESHTRSKMTTISEDATDDSDDEEMEFSGIGNQINDMLDEALDDSNNLSDEGPTPPELKRNLGDNRQAASSPSGTSAASWEYEMPLSASKQKDFKTPRIDGLHESPQAPLPMLDTESGPAPAEELMHTVSFYRRSKPVVQINVTPHKKIIRNPTVNFVETEQDEASASHDFKESIRKLQEDIAEQMQRRLQASKALEVCQSKNEFEGSCERVEFERLLLEAHHKHAAATAEINRLKSDGAKGALGKQAQGANGPMSKGTISISGLTLQLKQEFVRMLTSSEGALMDVHYFVCLVKYRSQVIASQMLSSIDGISRGGKLIFTNLININDLDFDFRIYLEVYGLQTPREHLSHEAKYHIRKDKSMFNLTPLKKIKKQDSRYVGSRHENPVNNLSIRKPKFGLVGYTTITIDNLKRKTFRLEKVPSMSPLEGGLDMKLSVHSESRIEESGFLTIFMDLKGLGNWLRRWCRLRDNTLFFWKYPEEEEKSMPPCFQISLHNCITDSVTLAPREICSRMNTFMLENQRPIQIDDKEGQTIQIDHNLRVVTLRYLLMADTRDERLQWCNVLNKALETLRAWDPTSARPRSGSQSSSCQASDEDTASSGSTVIW